MSLVDLKGYGLIDGDSFLVLCEVINKFIEKIKVLWVFEFLGDIGDGWLLIEMGLDIFFIVILNWCIFWRMFLEVILIFVWFVCKYVFRW